MPPSDQTASVTENLQVTSGQYRQFAAADRPDMADAFEQSIVGRRNISDGTRNVSENEHVRSSNVHVGNDNEKQDWERVSLIPFQTWEGYVTSVIPEERRFSADLHDKAAIEVSYSAEISLTDIDPEDLDLVKEGAVFYWTFGKVNIPRGSPVNYDQIRFRRLPNWTKMRLEAVDRKAAALYDFFQNAE